MYISINLINNYEVSFHLKIFNLPYFCFVLFNRLHQWDVISLEAAEFDTEVMLCCEVSLRVTRTTTVLDEM